MGSQIFRDPEPFQLSDPPVLGMSLVLPVQAMLLELQQIEAHSKQKIEGKERKKKGCCPSFEGDFVSPIQKPPLYLAVRQVDKCEPGSKELREKLSFHY